MSTPLDNDIKSFLNENGELIQSPVAVRNMGNFLALVIDAVSSHFPVLNRDVGIRCRKSGCTGSLRASLPARDAEITWYCPSCLQKGVIRNWQGTRWDHTARSES